MRKIYVHPDDDLKFGPPRGGMSVLIERKLADVLPRMHEVAAAMTGEVRGVEKDPAPHLFLGLVVSDNSEAVVAGVLHEIERKLAGLLPPEHKLDLINLSAGLMKRPDLSGIACFYVRAGWCRDTLCENATTAQRGRQGCLATILKIIGIEFETNRGRTDRKM